MLLSCKYLEPIPRTNSGITYMTDYDELDLLQDDGDGVVEMCLMEEEEERQVKRGSSENNSGCGLVFLILLFIVLLAGWIVSQML